MTAAATQQPDTSLALQILVVDVDAASRAALIAPLRGAGHRVESAASDADAREAIARRAFDVIVSAVQPPVMDGLALLHHLRQVAPLSDVLLVAGERATIEEAVAATRAGAIYLAHDARRTAAERDAALLASLAELGERRASSGALIEADTAATESPLLVGRSPAIVQLRKVLERIARSDGPVTIYGESGTGKELVARMIHEASPRHDRPLVAVNCGAFPDTLLEAELFGHERGAFPGAAGRRDGRLAAADGGTLFLDEIAEMSLVAQARLLRVLEAGSYERLGSDQTVTADVRVLSATSKDLERLVAEGRFREDLYYRIKLFRVVVPPLRERRADLPLLVEHFCRKHAPGTPPAISPWAWATLRAHDFPGNVRELEHAIRHAIAFAGGGPIQVDHLPPEIAASDPGAAADAAATAAAAIAPLEVALGRFEYDYLLRALEHAGGNRSRAARMLGISRKSLWAKLKRHTAPTPPSSNLAPSLSVMKP